MKRLFASAAVVAIAAIGIPVATTGSAGAAPVGGCPSGDGWFPPLPLADVDPALDVGNFHDQNGDGLVCVRINRGLTMKVRPPRAWTVKDNAN